MEDENNNKMNKTEENTLQSNEDVVMQDSESNKKKMDILDKMMDEITFSDSEDDDKKDKQPFVLDEKNYTEEMTKINKLYEQNIEEGVDEGTMNKYTGTRHEIINEKERKDYPIPFDVTLEDKFEECGIVKNIIENEILMIAINNNVLKVLNLDNIIFLSDKKSIGFIDDVIGQIDNPVYAIKLYPSIIDEKIVEKINPGDKLFFCSNRANVINAIELKNKSKGCDASNAFDEEVGEDEKDYSDDEEEVQAKIRRKNNKKNKKKKIEENTININNNDNNMQIDSNINQGINMINAPYSSENLNKSKEELNKKMDIFINNAMNMNINPFSSPFGLTDINSENNNGTLNNNSNTNL
jgi:H/ACA ribonucleoprotein complex non-core subunit NAF1